MSGGVIWITGLSGSGKTFLGRALFQNLKPGVPNLVFLDGDDFRDIMGNDLGHDPDGRVKNAWRISRCCKFLADQGIHVICATMSLYHEIRDWNRHHFPMYCEVYLRADLGVLRARDPKGLYKRAGQGLEKNIIGVDLPFEEPRHPDVIIDALQPPEPVDRIIHRIKEKLPAAGFEFS